MYLHVLSVLTTVFVSLALSADDNGCMVPVVDPSSIFNQDSATNATEGISEWKGETNQTCNAKCCQSEECTVSVFEAAQQQVDSRCQLYACQPLKSCDLRLGDGVAVFVRQVDSATTLKAEVSPQSDTTAASTDSETFGGATTASLEAITIAHGDTSTPTAETTTAHINSTISQGDTTKAPVDALMSGVTTTAQLLDGTGSQSSDASQNAQLTTQLTTLGSIATSLASSTAKDVLESSNTTVSSTASTNGEPATQSESQSLASQSQDVSLNNLTTAWTTFTIPQGPTEAKVTPDSQPLKDLTNDTASQETATITTSFSNDTSTDHNSSVTLSRTDLKATITPSTLSTAYVLSPDAENQTPVPASSADKSSPDLLFDTSTLTSTLTSSTGLNARTELNTTEAFHVDAITTTTLVENSTTTSTTTTAVTQNTEISDKQQTTGLPERNTTLEAHLTTVEENLTSSESKESASNSSLVVPRGKPSEEIHHTMLAILVCALSFGCVFLLVVVGVLGRRIYEGYQKRHYSRLDYLINGMYS